MNILDSILFGMLAGVITLKVLVLAAAAMMLVHVLTKHARPGRGANAAARTRHPRMDAHA